ncbi:MAG: right-handed parallel beta-helix repeat-containing protein [Filomicrobium sp.]
MVKDTNYAIPRAALFVAPNGSDRNRGTRKRPFRTVSAAINAAKPGSTIVIRAGTYRESLPDLSKRLTLQAYPNEKVWLKGSIVVRGWVREGRVWRKDDWRHSFCSDCFDVRNLDPEFPNAGLPEQVFVDGRPLKQVTSRSAVKRGTFFVDRVRRKLFVGTNPRGRTVEVSVHKTALVIWQGGRGSVVRGLGFAHYSPVAQPGLGGAIKGNAADLTFADNTIAWSAVKGLSIFAPNARVQGNTFVNNGMMGLSAWKADGLVLRGNRFLANNQEGFVQTGVISEAAGAKLTSSRNLSITDNVFEGNRANGLWIDIDVSGVTISRNVFKHNVRHGLFYEISSHGIIASNVMRKNKEAGIALSNATHVRVYHNTIVGNRYGLLIQDDDRVNRDALEIARGNTWVSGATTFRRNIVSTGGQKDGLLFWVRDYSGVLKAREMLTTSDDNAFYVPTLGGRIEWWDKRRVRKFDGLNDFQLHTRRDKNSVLLSKNLAISLHGRAGLNRATMRGEFAGRLQPVPRDVVAAIGGGGRWDVVVGAVFMPLIDGGSDRK